MSAEEPGIQAPAEFDASAAMVRAESVELPAMVHALVQRLSSVPGLELKVARRHGRLRRLLGDLPYLNGMHRRTDPIERIDVTVGACSYWLIAERSAVRCGRRGSSPERGTREEELSFGAWASALFAAIATQNSVNLESVAALRRLVERDRLF